MIIKVKITDESAPRGMYEGSFWRIFGDVTGLVYGKDSREDTRRMGAPPSDDDINRFQFITTPSAQSLIEGLFLTFYEDGQPTEVFTNNECYLMNDSGKTIEVLHD